MLGGVPVTRYALGEGEEDESSAVLDNLLGAPKRMRPPEIIGLSEPTPTRYSAGLKFFRTTITVFFFMTTHPTPNINNRLNADWPLLLPQTFNDYNK
jgi:hypothetical protein